MNEDPRTFRRMRIELGLSQAELARRVGIGRSRICDVERGRAGLAPKHLRAVADVFECKVHDLLLPEGENGTEDKRSIA